MTRESWENLGCGALALLGLMGIVFAFGLGLQFLAALPMPATLAEIEQLRTDSAHVDPAQAEDVIGQVTQWNSKSAAAKPSTTRGMWVGSSRMNGTASS